MSHAWRYKQAATYLRESLHNRAIPGFIVKVRFVCS
jgi:hypothetical protein